MIGLLQVLFYISIVPFRTLSASCQPEYSTLEESLSPVEYEVPLFSPTTSHPTVVTTSSSSSADPATSPHPEYSAVDGIDNGHVYSCLQKTGETGPGSVGSKEQGSKEQGSKEQGSKERGSKEPPPVQTEGQDQQQYQEEYSVLNHVR